MQGTPVVTSVDGEELILYGTEAFPVLAYDNDYTEKSVIWHWHREFEVIHVVEGMLLVQVPNEKIIVKAGEVVFINSEIMHSAKNAATGMCKFHTAVFLPEFVCNGEQGILWQQYVGPLIRKKEVMYVKFPMEQSETVEAGRLMKDFWDACRTELVGFEFKMRDDLSALVAMVVESTLYDKQLLQVQKRGVNQERIKSMVRYIHNNYMYDIHTIDIGKAANVSGSECLRCFKNALDTTPVQYLKKYRLKRAALQLRCAENSISEIAATCGFGHMSYFAECFEKEFGVLPREYRKTAPAAACSRDNHV